MAAVDLNDLVPSLIAQVSSPASPASTSLNWLQYLLNGFYLAQLEGLLKGWQCDDDGEVTQVGGSATLDRAQQQIIVLYAAIDITRNELRQLKAVFKAKAGPVQYETQQHATVLKTVLDSLLQQKDLIIDRLGDGAGGAGTYVLDSVLARDAALSGGTGLWVGY